MYSVKVYANKVNLEAIAQKEFKIQEGLYLKCFSVWRRDQDYAVEIAISENGFLQTFMVIVKKKDDYFIINVSQFSEVLKTEGIQKALKFLSEIIVKENILKEKF